MVASTRAHSVVDGQMVIEGGDGNDAVGDIMHGDDTTSRVAKKMEFDSGN